MTLMRKILVEERESWEKRKSNLLGGAAGAPWGLGCAEQSNLTITNCNRRIDSSLLGLFCLYVA
jgi:hypothetical protein